MTDTSTTTASAEDFRARVPASARTLTIRKTPTAKLRVGMAVLLDGENIERILRIVERPRGLTGARCVIFANSGHVLRSSQALDVVLP